jgi:L-erythrulose 1-phosphate isomerase
MEKVLLGTNWKMHKTVKEALDYTKDLLELVKDYEQYQFFIIPPYTDLWEVKNIAKGTGLLIGAQNMHFEDEGAFTGEISPKMLKEIGIDVVEIGHSERRQYYNETDYTVNRKVIAGIKYGFTPLICVGENMIDKEYGVTKEVIAKQMKIALHNIARQDVLKVWIAYEPVWAIGVNGVAAEPSYASMVQSNMRNVLVELYDEETANKIPILYGGSVNEDNAVELMKQKDIDGLFIGRSAWDVNRFRNIVERISVFK